MFTEIRLRPRQILLLIIVFFGTLIIVHRKAKQCPLPENLQQLYSQNRVLPTIYAITPTYARPVQNAELTRLSHVFMLVPNLFWVIVEDANTTSTLVKNLLVRAGLEKRSTQLYIKTPPHFKLKDKDPNWIKPRGVEQRNLGLQWVKSYAERSDGQHSIVFFMDDDNTYSVELFGEISKMERGKVGVWPVGLAGGLMVEKPLLGEDNRVIGFNSAWRPERPFPIDMAGFAVSADLLYKFPKAVFSYEVQRGYQESEFLRHVTVIKDLQPLANLCTEVFVWHTRTERPKLTSEEILRSKGERSDFGVDV